MAEESVGHVVCPVRIHVCWEMTSFCAVVYRIEPGISIIITTVVFLVVLVLVEPAAASDDDGAVRAGV